MPTVAYPTNEVGRPGRLLTAPAVPVPAKIEPSRVGWVISGIIVLQLAASMVDFGTLGLASGGFDSGRWLIMLPGMAFGAYLALTSSALSRSLLRGPALLITCWFLWALLGASWSLDTKTTILQMIPAITLFTTSYWLVMRYGVAAYAQLFCLAAGLVMVGGLAVDLLPALSSLANIDRTQFALDSGRSPGLTPGVNQLALLAGATIVLLTRLGGETAELRYAKLTGFGIAGAVLLSAGSRSVVICTILALVLGQAQGLSASQRSRLVGVGAGAALIGVGLVGSLGVQTTFQSGRDLNSLNGRGSVWTHALDLIVVRPLSGLGMMSGDVTWRQAYLEGRTVFDASDAHNIFLEVLITTGTIGLALFSLALIGLARRAWHRRDSIAGALLLLLVLVGLTEALISAATFVYSLLGAVFALVAVGPPQSKSWSDQDQPEHGHGLHAAADLVP